MSLKNKTAFLTGGGYGIGKQIALALAEQGVNLVIAARSLDKLEAVAAEARKLGVQARAAALDVTQASQVEKLVASVVEEHGKLDILVANSGIGGPTALARDVELSDWQQTIDVNLSGAFYCAKYASQPMIEAKQGCIINIGSIAGRIGFPHRTPYAASKWGMIGLSHSLAAELGPHGIRVNCILPGAVSGDRFDGVMANRAKLEGTTVEKLMEKTVATTPLGKLIPERDVADLAVFLASDAAQSITGQAINVDGGIRMQ